MLPVMHAHQNARFPSSESGQLLELSGEKTERLFHQNVGAGLEGLADRSPMEGRRTRDIHEIERLAVEHQVEVIVNARITHEIDRMMAALGDRIVNRHNRDLGPRAPSGKV